MKLISVLAAAVAMTVGTAALADAPVIKERSLVKTADGRKVGYVDRVLKNTAGEPTGVQIIYSGRFVVIPATTLAPADKGLVTSLNAKEVNKL